MRLPSLVLSVSVVATAAAHAQVPVVGIWRFDETSGTTAADSGPFANNATLFNFAAAPWVGGRLGNALQFDGVDDYCDVTFNGGYPFYTGFGEAFTIAFWVNGTPTDDDRLISLSSSTDGTPLLTFGTGRNSQTNTTKLQIFRRSDASGEYPQQYSLADVFDNTWHHVAYVEHSGFARLYVDGRPDVGFRIDTGSRFVTTDLVTFGNIHRPSLASPFCCHFTGALDDLHIYAFALNAADVATVQQGGVVINQRPSFGTFGTGCAAANSFGELQLIAFGGPALGSVIDFRVTGGEANAVPLLLLSVGRPGVVDLSTIGGAGGCTLYAALSGGTASFVMPPLGAFGSSVAGFPVPVPNNNALNGLNLTFQAIASNPLTSSNAVLAVIGS